VKQEWQGDHDMENTCFPHARPFNAAQVFRLDAHLCRYD